MRRLKKTLLIVALAASTATLAYADKEKKPEKIDNPEYLTWSQFKAGAMVEMENVTSTAGQETRMSTTTTLKTLTAKKAVVASQVTVFVAGKEIKQPAQDRDVPAKIVKPKPPKDAKKPDVKTEKGEETLTVDGKQVACTWVKTTMTIGGNTTVSKIWNSKAVPGGLVRMESSTKGAMKVATTMRVTKFATKAPEPKG